MAGRGVRVLALADGRAALAFFAFGEAFAGFGVAESRFGVAAAITASSCFGRSDYRPRSLAEAVPATSVAATKPSATALTAIARRRPCIVPDMMWLPRLECSRPEGAH